MKIERQKLLSALRHCAKVAGRKSLLPVLSHVQIVSGIAFGRLFATNLETGVRFDLSAETDGEWSICVPAQKFLDVINAGTERVVELDYDPKAVTLTVIDGKSKVKLKGIDGEEMPPEPGTGEGVAIGESFWRAVALTAPFASTDEARPNQTCIHVNGARLEATDGFRLAVAEIEDTGLNAMIPAKALVDAAGLFAGQSATLAIDKGSVVIDGGDCAYYAATVEGSFPDVSAIIPNNPPYRVDWNPAQMDAAVKLAMVTVAETSYLGLDIQTDGITLTTSSDDVGQSEVKVAAEGNNACALGVNGKFLRDALQVGGVSAMQYSKPNQPLLFTGAAGWVHVIMPMAKG